MEEKKEENKLVKIIAGTVLTTAAFSVAGCDYVVSYSRYPVYRPYGYRINDPFYSYPRYYPYTCPSTRRHIVPSPRISPHRQHSPTRPSPPSIRPSPNRPSRPNIPHRDRK